MTTITMNHTMTTTTIMTEDTKMTYRNSLQIMADVLETASVHGQDGATKTNLMRKANLSHSRLTTFLENMTGSGLINTIIYKNNHTYVLTPKGLQFLEEYKKFMDFAGTFGLEM